MASKSKKPKLRVVKGSKRKRAEGEGDHVRSLAPERAVRAFINDVIATKNATSEAGQGLSTATKRAAEQGVNVPAARLAARIYSKAKQDAMKGRVLWEDTVYYLIECMDFDKVAPKGMFTAEEGGQKRNRKPKQQELPVEAADHSRDFEGSDGGPLPIDEPVVTH